MRKILLKWKKETKKINQASNINEVTKWNENPESILPNYDFFAFPIFGIKLSHFKVQTIFSYATNTQA